MTEIVAWYIHGISGDDAPDSLDAVARVARRASFTPETLLQTDKWDYLIREGIKDTIPGYVALRHLAATKRGIATGANEFFHLPKSTVLEHQLPSHALVPCVGRAGDVSGVEFTLDDVRSLEHDNRRVFLICFGAQLTDAERAYIARGESEGVHQRYLLAVRKPWYSMEGQQPAPIWAAVFGRRGLRFVQNRARALTLTTFHCVYPLETSDEFVSALTLCLNLPSVQEAARAHTRVYGGGLLKFEPKDLLEICVPDLRRVSSETLARLAAQQRRIAEEFRRTPEDAIDWQPAEAIAREAANEAATCPPLAEHEGTRHGRKRRRLQQDGHKHHDAPDASPDAQLRSSVSGEKPQPGAQLLLEL